MLFIRIPANKSQFKGDLTAGAAPLNGKKGPPLAEVELLSKVKHSDP
jgi:hypothetical protein